ncbi:acyl-CoA carboxylase subunit beta [Chloroflexota bacterium]
MLAKSADNAFEPDAAGKPADGVVAGYGEIGSRPVFIWSQDATVLKGTLGAVGAKKITEVIEKALQARVPIISIIDSEGERIGDFIQYPHFYSLGSMCQSRVNASGVIPQINLVMGPCVGGLALFANLADFTFMTRNNSYMHVASPPGGITGNELGDSWMHAKTTGCCDVLAESDEDCLQKCRQLLRYLPGNNKEKSPFVDTGDDPNRMEEELLDLVPANEAKTFDMYRLISLVVDNGEFFEISRYWARNLLTVFARMGGQTAGIIANNPQDKGGCMNVDAADKMARFVRFCDAFNIPLIWIADCPAFLPSVEEETRGIIRHGSKTIFSNTLATVPQITIAVRKLYGGGGLAMPGTRLGGDFFVAWPTISRGLMGAEGAAAILYGKELGRIQDEAGKEEQRLIRVKEVEERLESLQREASQEIIDPRSTRPFLIKALKLLGNKRQELPPRRNDNIRL